MRYNLTLRILLAITFLAQGCTVKNILYKKQPVAAVALTEFHPNITTGEYNTAVNLDSLYELGISTSEGETVFPESFWLSKYQRFSSFLSNGGVIDYFHLGFYKKRKAHIVLSRLNLGGSLTTSELFLIRREKEYLKLIGRKGLQNIRDNEVKYDSGTIYVNKSPSSIKDFFDLQNKSE